MNALSTIELRFEPLERDVLRGVRDPQRNQHRIGVDLGVVPFFADERPLQGLAALLDWRGCGFLSRLIRGGWLSGKAQEALLMPGPPGFPARRLVLFGLGRSEAFVGAEAQRLVHEIVRVVLQLEPRDVLFSMPAWLQEAERSRSTLAALTEALRADGTWRLALPPAVPIPKSRPLVPGVAARAQQQRSVHGRRTTPASIPVPPDPERSPTPMPRESQKAAEVGAGVEGAAQVGSLEAAADSADAPPSPEGVVVAPPVSAPDSDAAATMCWWIVAEEDHVGSLRDVLEQHS